MAAKAAQDAASENWKFDFVVETMGDFRALTTTWNDALKADDFLVNYDFMAAHIVAWPYAADPKNAATYDELTPRQCRKAMEQTTKALADFFRPEEDAT